MALTYYKAVADAGGAKGSQIFSGIVDTILPEITLANQTAGVVISRKFYIANSEASDVIVSNLSMDDYTVFATILFESSGDTQVVGDLTGSETNESPISFDLASGASTSFWLQIAVPASSTETVNYQTISTQLNY